MAETRTYIQVTWVAQTYNKPIVTAHTWEDLLAGLDDYYQNDGERLRFISNDSPYVESFDGYFEYEVDDYNGGRELERVDVFCVDFYPHTRYEKEI